MATRAQEARYRAERTGKKKAKKARRAKGRHTEAVRAGKKATVAKEAPSLTGRRSRKSTRAGKNRLKADTNFNLREERAGRAPETRARKEAAKRKHPRGKRR
jgi:hypothetical protein